jgi:D-glycero-beta-D-manno-heptose-7-phosphate kinase
VDRYWRGDVSRISPEAPVPVVKLASGEVREGGAANVVNNIRALGGEAIGIYSPSEDKVIKIRVIGRSQQMLRIDLDAPQDPISPAIFADAAQDVGIVVFSDYGKGALSNVANLITMAKARHKFVLVDPKGHDYRRYRGADLVKPNKDEMKELVGGWSTEDELTDKATTLMQAAGIGAILLTRAAEGMTLYTPQDSTHIHSVAREVYDVSGAGDTVMAAVAYFIERDYTILAAAEMANYAARVTVSKFGTATCTMDELREAMNEKNK